MRRSDMYITVLVYLNVSIVTAFTHAPIKLVFDRARARYFNWLFTNRKIPPQPVQHVQNQYFEFLTALGVPPNPVVWDLGPWEDERGWQRTFSSSFDRPIASIVVGTSKPEKDWLPERWAEVVDALHETYRMRVVLVGGRSERELAPERRVMELARNKPRSE